MALGDFFRPETINWNQGGQTTIPSQFSNILGKIGQVAGGLDNFAYENQIGQYAPPEVISNGADVGAYNQAVQGAYAPYRDMMARREQLMQRRKERERKRRFQGALGNIGRTGGFAGPLEPYSDILMSAESPEEFAALGKMFQSMEPETTANIREYQLAQQDPEFGAYLDKRGQRQLSGTEAIVSQLMSEDPNLSYYEALALAQGLARKGLAFKDGVIAPLPGVEASLGSLSGAGKAGETAPLATQKLNESFVTNTFDPALEAAAGAKEANARLALLENIDIDTGWGVEAKAYGARVLEGLGFDSDAANNIASNAQAFKSIISKQVNEELILQKGPQTEGDAQRAFNIQAQLGNTPQANKFIIDVNKALNQKR